MVRRNMAVEGVLPGGSYTVTIRADYPNRPGMLGNVASIIGMAGGDISSIDLVEADRSRMVRDITVGAQNSEHARRIIDTLKRIPGFQVRSASDRVFLSHLGGKIAVQNRIPVKTRRDLSNVYTPGVARVSTAIAQDPEVVWTLTGKGNTVAIVTNGTAVLGLGDIGPKAALPVMEGKAMLFKEFADVDAWPICLDAREPDEIVRVVKALAPGFGGINLEDIAAPACFEIEARLRAELDIPVFHDDQHGTSVVVLAALLNALKIVGKRIEDIRVCVCGVGAAGTACTEMMLAAGVREVIGVDRYGIVYPGRPEGMNPALEAYARGTNPEGGPGTVHDAIAGADVFLGVSAANLIDATDVETHEQGRHRLRHGQPGPGGHAGPDRRYRAHRRHRTVRLPQPDQQRIVLPRPVPRRARRARHGDKPGDEAGGGARHRRRGRQERAVGGVHHPQRVQPQRGARGSPRGLSRSARHGCRTQAA